MFSHTVKIRETLARVGGGVTKSYSNLTWPCDYRTLRTHIHSQRKMTEVGLQINQLSNQSIKGFIWLVHKECFQQGPGETESKQSLHFTTRRFPQAVSDVLIILHVKRIPDVSHEPNVQSLRRKIPHRRMRTKKTKKQSRPRSGSRVDVQMFDTGSELALSIKKKKSTFDTFWPSSWLKSYTYVTGQPG